MQRRVELTSNLTDPCRVLLGPERAALFDELMAPDTGDPDRLLEALRDDPGFGFALIECDTVDRLQPLFSDQRGEFSSEASRSGPLGDTAFGVAWEYETVYDKPEAFNGVLALSQEVTVRGFSMLALDDDPDDDRRRIMVRRYVDWAGVFGQLGLSVNWRVPVSSPD